MPFVTEKFNIAKVGCLEEAPPGDIFYDFKSNIAGIKPKNFDAVGCKGCSFYGLCDHLSGLKSK
jgi:hypothetical protein